MLCYLLIVSLFYGLFRFKYSRLKRNRFTSDHVNELPLYKLGPPYLVDINACCTEIHDFVAPGVGPHVQRHFRSLLQVNQD